MKKKRNSRAIVCGHKRKTRNAVTYKYISNTEKCTFDKVLKAAGIEHKLIPPRTPWHNGKAERSHRNDQRYFY